MPRFKKTITIPSTKKNQDMLEKFPSAGPHPNITGMKKQFWGEDALCIRCGVYVYKVDKATYDRFLT